MSLPENLRKYVEDAEMVGAFVVLWRELDQVMRQITQLNSETWSLRTKVETLRDGVAKLVEQLELPKNVTDIFRFEIHQKGIKNPLPKEGELKEKKDV